MPDFMSDPAQPPVEEKNERASFLTSIPVVDSSNRLTCNSRATTRDERDVQRGRGYRYKKEIR